MLFWYGSKIISKTTGNPKLDFAFVLYSTKIYQYHNFCETQNKLLQMLKKFTFWNLILFRLQI